MVAIINKNIMRPERIAVRAEGDLVVLSVGNAELKLHYNDALTLAGWLRIRAREAKRTVGDTSRRLQALGVLSALDH